MNCYLITDIHEYIWGKKYATLIDNYRENLGVYVLRRNTPKCIPLSQLLPEDNWELINPWHNLCVRDQFGKWNRINYGISIINNYFRPYVCVAKIYCRCEKFDNKEHVEFDTRKYTTECPDYLKRIMGIYRDDDPTNIY